MRTHFPRQREGTVSSPTFFPPSSCRLVLFLFTLRRSYVHKHTCISAKMHPFAHARETGASLTRSRGRAGHGAHLRARACANQAALRGESGCVYQKGAKAASHACIWRAFCLSSACRRLNEENSAGVTRPQPSIRPLASDQGREEKKEKKVKVSDGG